MLTWSNCLFDKINVKGREITLYVQVSIIYSADDLNKIKTETVGFLLGLEPGSPHSRFRFFQPPYFMSQTKSSKHTNIILHVFCFSRETS